ncbi:putative sulfurtransferase [Frateuria aurantia DSM 6220]|uniref:tRNA uridine(34) hydroxylase n=2 Tax=Frateuria aurantia TaxID=81475 RepID=H8L0P6_FRAAD|nr:putative sulfurtransferase [Frateuria aurantia DSM 6220]
MKGSNPLAMPMSVVNISAYKFIALDALEQRQQALRERCEALQLKGTVLLAPEGINIFLAGERAAIDAIVAWLRRDPKLADLDPKESISDTAPFGKLRIRLKKEIITMRHPQIRPEGGRAPSVSPETLQRWLQQGRDDEGREVVMLDTRNDYEIACGKFSDAVDYGLTSFTGFPDAIAADRERFRERTVVSYCTGGIRCEKAALHMQELGMEHVYQLEGGILRYLEYTDADGWEGNCFVFDERGALDAGLKPAPLPAEPS